MTDFVFVRILYIYVYHEVSEHAATRKSLWSHFQSSPTAEAIKVAWSIHVGDRQNDSHNANRTTFSEILRLRIGRIGDGSCYCLRVNMRQVLNGDIMRQDHILSHSKIGNTAMGEATYKQRT